MSNFRFCNLGYFILTIITLLNGLYAIPALAENRTEFILPIACTLQEDCWVVQYLDVTPAPNEAKDFMCGSLTSENEKGTAIAIADRLTMELGVDVISPADGVITNVRAQTDKTPENRCGNGILINHGQGWQSTYCYLKEDSITVKQGQKVKSGEKIASVGMTGRAPFPMLNWGLYYNSIPTDPFSGITDKDGCDHDKAPLWPSSFTPIYQPVSVFASGFQNSAPEIDALKIDTTRKETLNKDSDAFVLWAGLYGLRKDDKISIKILDPHYGLFTSREIMQEQDRLRQYYFAGRHTDKFALTAGKYTGQITVNREGYEAPILRETIYIDVQ